ncbi:MAG: BBP7 family outer membrane beta-barrel protein, partial [Pirellulaceae bacterium]|nr:BBP7 family outer membrane beta-barrel protein [Pirellulaceae bacterium]
QDVAPGSVGVNIPPAVAPEPMMNQYAGSPGHYDDGCGPNQYGGQDCYDDGYDNGHGGRFRARRGMRMSNQGPTNDYYYDRSNCDRGDCGDGYDDARSYNNRGNGQNSSGSRFSRLFDKCGRDVYTVVGARWLYMRRDGADYKSLSYENAMPSNTLLVSDANLGHQHGVEAFIVRQDDCGQGWEGRYWGLQSQTNCVTLGNMPVTQLTGLGSLPIPPWGNVGALYNGADYHRLERTSEFHSFEWNLLNHANVCSNNNWLYRGIFGIRVLRFRDALKYSANSSSGFGFGFNTLSYNLATRNTFVGAQAGGSGEYCVTDKLRLGLGANAGVGTNFIDADQEIVNSNGAVAPHPGGGNFSYMNSANDLSIFGELDARLYYHISCNWRLSCGYRFLGLTGVALAQDQIPYAFTSLAELNSVKRDGGLLLHGLTMGAEFSY